MKVFSGFYMEVPSPKLSNELLFKYPFPRALILTFGIGETSILEFAYYFG